MVLKSLNGGYRFILVTKNRQEAAEGPFYQGYSPRVPRQQKVIPRFDYEFKSFNAQ
jgi:hypothetical protein